MFKRALIALALPSVALAANPTLAHQGRLLSPTGGSISGAHTVRLELWDALSGGVSLHQEDFALTLQDGYYAVILGTDPLNLLDPADLAADAWLEITVDPPATPMSPRTRLNDAPRAAVSLIATGGSGGGSGGGTDGLDWVDAPSSLTMEVNRAYLTTTASDVTLNLPGTCATGDAIHVRGGSGPFRIGALAGQVTHDIALSASSSGPHTRIRGTRFSTVDLLCVSSNEWHVREVTGVAGLCQGVANLVPTMATSSPGNGFILTSHYTSSYPPHRAFDNNLASPNAIYGWLGQSSLPGWLAIQFPVPTVVNTYTVSYGAEAQAGMMIKTWQFQGSTNGATWVTLDTRNVEAETFWRNSPPSWAGTPFAVPFTFANADPYQHYRIYITNTADGGTNMNIGGMGLMNCN